MFLWGIGVCTSVVTVCWGVYKCRSGVMGCVFLWGVGGVYKCSNGVLGCGPVFQWCVGVCAALGC